MQPIEVNKIYAESCIETMKRMPNDFLDSVVTSTPYFGLRNYGVDGQIGLEETPQEYIANLVSVFDEARRVLKPDGTLWLNLGDSYCTTAPGTKAAGTTSRSPRLSQGARLHLQNAERGKCIRPQTPEGMKPKDLMLIPARVAIALQEAGWWVRSDIPWVKRSAMPESALDRPAKALEYVYLLTKSEEYYFDMEAIKVVDSGLIPGNRSQHRSLAIDNEGAQHRTKAGLAAYAQKQRDRSLPQNRNGITGSLDSTPPGVRHFRNSDLWFESIKKPHGLTGIGDEIVGIDVNPGSFGGEFCKACRSYFEGPTKNALRVEQVEGEDSPRRYCTCGKYDQWLSHFATFPAWLISPFIRAGSRAGGIVYDPFGGSGTTALTCHELGRRWILSELNPDYVEMANLRLKPFLDQGQLF